MKIFQTKKQLRDAKSQTLLVRNYFPFLGLATFFQFKSETAFRLAHFGFYEKATKVWKNHPLVFTLLSKRQTSVDFVFKFCGLLTISVWGKFSHWKTSKQENVGQPYILVTLGPIPLSSVHKISAKWIPKNRQTWDK